VEKGVQAVKAPEVPGAKASEQHKVEGRGEGTERGREQVGWEWGLEGSGILIFTQELGEKAEILRREEEAPMRAENEEGNGRKESEMEDGEAVKAEDKLEEEHRSKEPQMGDGEAIKSEGAEEISGGEEEKRVDPQAGYAGRVR
jgi:hypothetical protein